MSESNIPAKRSHPCKVMTKAAYRAYRKKHVKLWQASGLSKSDYAEQIGASTDAVRDWIRDFATDVSPKLSQPGATLVPVRIQPTSQTNQSNGLKLTRTDGIALEWQTLPDAAWLAELLRSMA